MDSHSKDDIAFISFNKGGSMYIAYKENNVTNHIKPGTKPRNELLIIGIPPKKVFKWLYENDFTMDDLIDKMNTKESTNEQQTNSNTINNNYSNSSNHSNDGPKNQ